MLIKLTLSYVFVNWYVYFHLTCFMVRMCKISDKSDTFSLNYSNLFRGPLFSGHGVYLEYATARNVYIVSYIQNKNYQVSKLHQKHYKPSFLIIVICHYLSLVSQLSVNYVRCSSVTACCYAKQDVSYSVCHSHSHYVIPISTPIPISSPKAIPIPMRFPWDSHSHGNSYSHAHL